MEKDYLTIQDVAKYLSIKESTIYTKVSEIPHYRIGRLLRFSKKDIDGWLETKRETQRTLPIRRTRSTGNRSQDIDKIIRKAIDETRGTGYTSGKGKSDRNIKGLKKGGEDGAV
jgi:excisionase family DNA binding protein